MSDSRCHCLRVTSHDSSCFNFFIYDSYTPGLVSGISETKFPCSPCSPQFAAVRHSSRSWWGARNFVTVFRFPEIPQKGRLLLQPIAEGRGPPYRNLMQRATAFQLCFWWLLRATSRPERGRRQASDGRRVAARQAERGLTASSTLKNAGGPACCSLSRAVVITLP